MGLLLAGVAHLPGAAAAETAAQGKGPGSGRMGVSELWKRVWGVKDTMKVRMLDFQATPPMKSSEEAAWYDPTTLEDFELAPGERRLSRTGLSIQLPKGTLC